MKQVFYFLLGFSAIPLVSGIVSVVLTVAVALAIWIKP